LGAGQLGDDLLQAFKPSHLLPSSGLMPEDESFKHGFDNGFFLSIRPRIEVNYLCLLS
jgi:hypothetical protein